MLHLVVLAIVAPRGIGPELLALGSLRLRLESQGNIVSWPLLGDAPSYRQIDCRPKNSLRSLYVIVSTVLLKRKALKT